MKTMSFKTFTFPRNPETVEITTKNMISTAHCPEYGPVHQHLGPAGRSITGHGVFFGENARESFVGLETLLWERTPGALVVPGLGTVVAYLKELTLREEGDGTALRYAFRFEELIAATDEEGTRYVD